jgi:hypothetical protein
VVRSASCPVLTLRRHPSDVALARMSAVEIASPSNDGTIGQLVVPSEEEASR